MLLLGDDHERSGEAARDRERADLAVTHIGHMAAFMRRIEPRVVFVEQPVSFQRNPVAQLDNASPGAEVLVELSEPTAAVGVPCCEMPTPFVHECAEPAKVEVGRLDGLLHVACSEEARCRSARQNREGYLHRRKVLHFVQEDEVVSGLSLVLPGSVCGSRKLGFEALEGCARQIHVVPAGGAIPIGPKLLSIGPEDAFVESQPLVRREERGRHPAHSVLRKLEVGFARQSDTGGARRFA